MQSLEVGQRSRGTMMGRGCMEEPGTHPTPRPTLHPAVHSLTLYCPLSRSLTLGPGFTQTSVTQHLQKDQHLSSSARRVLPRPCGQVSGQRAAPLLADVSGLSWHSADGWRCRHSPRLLHVVSAGSLMSGMTLPPGQRAGWHCPFFHVTFHLAG